MSPQAGIGHECGHHRTTTRLAEFHRHGIDVLRNIWDRFPKGPSSPLNRPTPPMPQQGFADPKPARSQPTWAKGRQLPDHTLKSIRQKHATAP